jgi:predicted dienelactone hydrolase
MTLRRRLDARAACSRCSAAWLGLLALAVALAGCGGNSDGGSDGGGGSSATALTSVAPLTLPGPYPIACSNVAQAFTGEAQSAAQAQAYWEGRPAPDGTSRYATDLLTDPANTLSVTVNTPNDATLFGSFAGKPIPFVVLACYPTTADNSRSDFAMPTGKVVPRMQTGAQPPLFADASVRYPVLAFSHGLVGSPLSGDHFVVLSWLASFGYVVVAPFHGDPRFTNLQIADFGDALTVLSHLSDAVAMQALRPLSVSASLDLLLAHPQWREHLDAAQIGGFGASIGGETMMLMGGAALTTTVGLASSSVGVDQRIKAAVGYVPYFGQPLLPAFGRDQHGLDSVTLPYLAISGTSDRIAPVLVTQQGMTRLQGTRELVTLVGGDHEFNALSSADVMTWSVTFLDALVSGKPTARATLTTMTSVEGGSDDRVVLPLSGPLAP